MGLRKRQYFVEKIQVGVRSPSKLIDHLIKRGRSFIKYAKTFKNELVNDDGKDRFYSDVIGDRVSSYKFQWSMLDEFEKSLQDLSWYMNKVFTGKVTELRNSVVWRLEEIVEELYSFGDDIARKIRDADKRDDWEWEYNIKSGNTNLKFKRIVEAFPDKFYEIDRIVALVSKKISEIPEPVSRSIFSPDPKDILPSHGDIERLYHASIMAKKLARTGFASKRPGGRGLGLGGSTGLKVRGEDIDGISFTYDLYIAKEIARVFKELAMAAKGQLKASKIFGWAKRSGIQKEVWNTYIGVHGGTSDMMDKSDAVKMLLSYLWFDKKRYNPVFMSHPDNIQKVFSKINPSDIGVVVADVNMINVREYKSMHMPAEREIRVLPKDIVRIINVI